MTRALLAAALAALVLVGVYLAAGGGSYEVTEPADPCTRAAPPATGGGLERTAERLALTALDGAACDLGVSRERLVITLSRDRRLPTEDEERQEDAVRAGLQRTIDAEQQAGRLGETQAQILRQLVAIAPIDAVLDQLLR